MGGLTPSFLVEAALMGVVLLFSIIIHEVAHAYVAWLNGDPTARLAGRLTLNPLPHIDPIGTLLLPILLIATGSRLLFGWARPVPINPLNFRHLRQGQIAVSLAGPLSNLALAAGFAFLLKLPLDNPGLDLMGGYGCSINIFLALFNLIPIPPLDGSHIVEAVLPPHLARYYQNLEPFGFIIILLMFYSGLMSFLLMPLYRYIARVLLGG
jgi:Zn-dependent protease